jgi:hypothetical protein
MAYLIPIVLVLLLVSGFITFLVLNATRKSKPSEAENSEDNDPETMAASDPSPLGDTTEHAGEQSGEGGTAEDPEGGGEAGETGGGDVGDRRGDRPEPTRSPGGTAHAPRIDSERLADRP